MNRLPVIFIGHGNPMNGIRDNAFTRSLKSMADRLPKPEAVLCISAHWMTEGTWVTAMKQPKTIHDFYGFPQELFDVQYPAPGHPDVANLIHTYISDVHLDSEAWGLDHGSWTVLKHMYPEAQIPVMQLSLYMSKSPDYHYRLGEELRRLREKDVLIVGSGNIVHNLRRMSWSEDAKPFDWAVEFDEWVKNQIESRNHSEILKKALDSEAGRLSVPSMDHWYPLLYTLGASDHKDELRFEYEGIDNSSISMRTFSLG